MEKRQRKVREDEERKLAFEKGREERAELLRAYLAKLQAAAQMREDSISARDNVNWKDELKHLAKTVCTHTPTHIILRLLVALACIV